MSEPSDKIDEALADSESEDEGRGVESSEGEIHRVDTVPPPESGDAYSADTVIRDVPREALDAIRDRKHASEKRRASAPAPTEESIMAEDKKSADATVAEKKSTSVETTSPRAKAPAAAHPSPSKGPPPVTGSELMIAFAAVIALIVVGFYVIGSAF